MSRLNFSLKPLALVCLVPCMIVSPCTAQPVALTGATLYDGTDGAPIENSVVLVEEGRLACVGTAESCAAPQGAELIDLSGRYVTPGLVDAHVHHAQTGWLDGRPDSRIGTDLYDYEALQKSLRADPGRWHRAYLCSGITAVFDPGGLPWTLELEAESEDDPERVHVVSTGPLITHFEPVFGVVAAGGSDTFLPMQTDEEAIRSVRRLARMGSRAVKVWYLDPPEEKAETLDARLLLIGRVTQVLGLPLVVHATGLRAAKVALQAGAHTLVHSVMDEPVDDEFLRLAREGGTYYSPTLLVMRNWERATATTAVGLPITIDDPNGCVDAETRRVIQDAAALRETLSDEQRDLRGVFGGLESAGEGLAVMTENLKRVHDAGIPVATSTDAGNPLTFHGPSIYDEMEAMESAGISPAEVIVMSTRNGAALMGRSEDFGTLEAGKLADLIVLADDPGESTSAFRSITHVMKGGVLREIGYFAGE